MRWFFGSCCLLVALAATVPVAAQTTTPLPPVAVPPANVMLPNYNSVAIGEIGGLEANAFLARANDSSGAYYNPAGLTLAKQTSVSGSAALFQYTSVTPKDFNSGGSSLRLIPAMASLVLKDLFGYENLAGGVSVTTVNAWSQSVNGERNVVVGDTNERVMYSSAAELSGWMINVGAGYNYGKWRVGATLDGQITTANRAETLSDQYQTPSGLNALVVQAHGNSWFGHLRMSGGVQFDVTPEVRVGAVMRTPGLKISSGGSYNHEGMSQQGGTTTTASFYEPGSNVDYKLPFEFKFGAAYMGKRAQVEVDVLTYQGAGAYPASAGTTAQWTILTDTGAGGPAAVQQRSFDPPIIESQSVVNVAVGGQYTLTSDGKWTVHGGWATDGSPVGDNDTYFTKVDMQVFTAGVSFRKGAVLASGAFRYESGTSGTIGFRPLQDGLTLSTTMHVSNVGLVYSVALMF